MACEWRWSPNPFRVAAQPAHAADGPDGAPASPRPRRPWSALLNVGLCADWHDGPQLMRMPLDGTREHGNYTLVSSHS